MKIDGVMAALITPLTADGDLDAEALVRLVDHATGGGANGVLVLGSTGEATYLPRPMRKEVVEAAVKAGDRVGCQVIAGLCPSAPSEAIDEAGSFLASGCKAILAIPPTYGPADARKTERYLRVLSRGLGKAVLAYHIPALTGTPVPVEVVMTLADEGVIVGLKDSGRDLEYLQGVAHGVAATEFSLLTGADTLLMASLLLGASGAVTVGAGLAPRLTTGLFQAVRSGDITTARILQRDLTSLITGLRVGAFPAGFKYALSRMGLAEPHPAAPAPALTADEKQRVESALIGAGIIRSATAAVGP